MTARTSPGLPDRVCVFVLTLDNLRSNYPEPCSVYGVNIRRDPPVVNNDPEKLYTCDVGTPTARARPRGEAPKEARPLRADARRNDKRLLDVAYKLFTERGPDV